jgi:signal transduction histidine kinase
MDLGIVLILQPIHLGWASQHHPAVTVPLELATTLPLLVRRRYPLAVLAAVATGTALTHHFYDWGEPLALWFGLFTVALRLPRRVSLPATAVTAGLLVAAGHPFRTPSGVAGELFTAAVAWVLGDTIKSRRAFLAEEREESARRAVAGEQARIARELHDVIAHNVSVMVVQAAAANDVFDSRPEKARDALRSIEDTGRAALTELRRLLGTVRTPEEEAFVPQPGLSRLRELVSRVEAAGLPVAVHLDGELGDLPAGLDLSAYRIVQEALTNTLKHARASRAEVGVRRTSSGLELEIVDDGVGNGDGASGGHGLIGMQERASLVGGEVSAGPRPGGGFQVRARLPL